MISNRGPRSIGGQDSVFDQNIQLAEQLELFDAEPFRIGKPEPLDIHDPLDITGFSVSLDHTGRWRIARLGHTQRAPEAADIRQAAYALRDLEPHSPEAYVFGGDVAGVRLRAKAQKDGLVP